MLSVRPMMWLAAMRIGAACDHVLHTNSTLVVDLATSLSLSSQRLPASRLLLPRSGLERSDFVLWPIRVILLPRSSCVGLGVKQTCLGTSCANNLLFKRMHTNLLEKG